MTSKKKKLRQKLRNNLRTYTNKSFIQALSFLLLVGATYSVSAKEQRRGGTEGQYAAIQAFHNETVVRFADEDLEGSVNDYLPQLPVAHTKGMAITGRDGLGKSWGQPKY
jgi:hypothetical protein